MQQFNFKLISRILGILLLIESLFMFLSAGVSLIYSESDLFAFLISTFITGAVGGSLLYLGRSFENNISKREGYLIVTVSWIFFSIFGMLPFIIS